ncbi:hypothetical protein ABFS82_08G066500 [Erythranthe guttata]|uniref:Uncharacterized protein n=1 Tax=Erythranthe guttata TaxID=4155 RepID=A0A022RVN5_ERYGU|nr:PREDICTED: uncharacterized protein At1g66480 [Erythranthe guttata]EYU44582.1 hypothetical protein MIMGU_mgv1a025559mg [Erythranthe guttata]|eukprot:XP_012855812.1 PREDICTED: uncharacterized protein At1g66480 [Erythranthe guttata]
MGNGIGGSKKKAKIMKVNGETFKLKVPATATDVLKDYPAGYVLLESKTVKRYGVRAPELEPGEEIRPGKTYFLLEMPKFPEPRTRRSRSVVYRSGAEERLDGLMLRRQKSSALEMVSGSGLGLGSGTGSDSVRVRLRIPKAQMVKMMRESKDEGEVTERIVDLCLQKSRSSNNGSQSVFSH